MNSAQIIIADIFKKVIHFSNTLDPKLSRVGFNNAEN